ncbi:MAG: succinyldiaminopimelate transaminase [Gammaproteobacteria bacterium]|nr:succinyldiaminopimelate transaminase [Gammaproteobacteria bacterium]MYD81033.1 succinyldiaminopimelate transaminase [Gammaproteobacteria bacterium]
MNRYLERLQPYPFERLNQLKSDFVSISNQPHVSLALGEPKHEAPELVVHLLRDEARLRSSLDTYPSTRGSRELRETIAAWIAKRFGSVINPETQVLPVNGTREGLFSFGQAILGGSTGRAVLPNPFYQIYQGATLLAGTDPYYAPCTEKLDIDLVPKNVWRQTKLLFLCTPNNPSGATLELDELKRWIELAQKHDFVIASDECYSEIYNDEECPPCGILQAASDLGIDDFRNCVSFNSLSKRSNVPGLRSGFAAGDPKCIAAYFQYRTYHGCAMPDIIQEASQLLWSNEDHVDKNRALYRAKFEQTHPLVKSQFGCELPTGAFYFWPDIEMDDEQFAAELFLRENITVLPGKYIARTVNGHNPGANRIRIALVAPLDECVDAIQRLCFTHSDLTA